MEFSIVESSDVLADDRIAYRISTAAQLVDLSTRTLRREINRGNLRQGPYGLISRSELLRWFEHGSKHPKLFPRRRHRRPRPPQHQLRPADSAALPPDISSRSGRRICLGLSLDKAPEQGDDLVDAFLSSAREGSPHIHFDGERFIVVSGFGEADERFGAHELFEPQF